MVDQEKIHNQCLSDDPEERIKAIEQLHHFASLPNKKQAWDDYKRLTEDKDNKVRSSVANTLGFIFSDVPDKQQAWNDLHRLTKDKVKFVRALATKSLGYAFSDVPDKQQAWSDLQRLTKDEDKFVRSKAAYSLCYAFFYMPDKQQAWNDLHRLINDENSDVRSSAAEAFRFAFPHVPDKQQAWNDLQRLTNDENNFARTEANHSLGRVSIFKASHAGKDEDYKKELENAIKFFESAAQEAPARWFNPSQFCLPFYRSFHTIIFKKQEVAEEVNKYLEEAKAEIEGSENKKQLFEAVENLAEALKKVQNMGNLDLSRMKDELNFYRKYCDRAVELMKDTEETAPLATEVMRKGLPILDRNIKRILEEIQEKAKNTYKQSQGTVTEKIAYSVCREVQNWEIGSPEEMTQKVEDIAYVLKKKIGYVPENEYVLNKIEAMRSERNLVKQYETLLFVIEQIPTITVVPEDVVVENINKVGQELGTKVDGLSQEINEIRISLSPGITQEIEISSGIEILGTGAALITTIPLQEISYAELKEDLQRIKGENISKLSELPKRLANKIKGYLLMKDREDIVEQLT
ncbi:HEAT repeat domain-containing protein [Methanosarcina barkeri]|uniref:HEAT repeat-containing protein n=1 Tax=Methanosarcina barkeri CM1 TaxID=796385 RepID=A0A0G3CDD9_METBA|nr:HEAT repeat domain-containing protein [Methanosarcina barkeri]AKJ37893.1 HEAT repeat-containing protein [Methanosarcina barkeri CM1]